MSPIEPVPYYPPGPAPRHFAVIARISSSSTEIRSRFLLEEVAPRMDALIRAGVVSRWAFLLGRDLELFIKVHPLIDGAALADHLERAFDVKLASEFGLTWRPGAEVRPLEAHRHGDLRGVRLMDLFLWQISRMDRQLWNVRETGQHPLEAPLASILFLLDTLMGAGSPDPKAIDRWIDDLASILQTGRDSLAPDPAHGARARAAFDSGLRPDAALRALTQKLSREGWRATPTHRLRATLLRYERKVRILGRALVDQRSRGRFPAMFPWQRTIFCNYLHFHLFNIGITGTKELYLYWLIVSTGDEGPADRR